MRNKQEYTNYYENRNNYYDNNYYNTFFTRRQYFTPDLDLIKPYLTYSEKSFLPKYINETLVDGSSLVKIISNYPILSGYNAETLSNELRMINSRLPKELLFDIYKTYFYNIDKLTFKDRNNTNRVKYRLIEYCNNSIGKILTETSSFKSLIFTKNIYIHLLVQILLYNKENNDNKKDIDNIFKDLGDDSKKDTTNDGTLDNILSSNDPSNAQLQKIISASIEECQKIDKTFTEEQQKQLYDSAITGKASSKSLNSNVIEELIKKINNVITNTKSLTNVLKKIIDKGISYFSKQKKVIKEDLFSSDHIGNLDEFELLHPKLRKLFIEDIDVNSAKYFGKINIYLDISGSMTDQLVVNKKRIKAIDFAKSIVVKLKELGLLDEFYIFNDSVKTTKSSDIIDIISISTSGGTSINSVVNHIQKNNKNAIIITDAADRCCLYSDKAFFIGLPGSDFSGFDNQELKKYTNNEQMIIFDGDQILKINENGKATQ